MHKFFLIFLYSACFLFLPQIFSLKIILLTKYLAIIYFEHNKKVSSKHAFEKTGTYNEHIGVNGNKASFFLCMIYQK